MIAAGTKRLTVPIRRALRGLATRASSSSSEGMPHLQFSTVATNYTFFLAEQPYPSEAMPTYYQLSSSSLPVNSLQYSPSGAIEGGKFNCYSTLQEPSVVEDYDTEEMHHSKSSLEKTREQYDYVSSYSGIEDV